MKRYCNVEPILHLLSDKDLLESVNVGAVLQALQHGLYNGEVAPVAHAHWEEIVPGGGKLYFRCSNCSTTFAPSHGLVYKYCFYCGAKMDEKEGNI